MYMYIFDGADGRINTPGIADFSQVKKELVHMSSDKIITRVTYPTGLVLEFEVKTNQTIIYSNRQLIQGPDGTYTAPEP